MQAGHLTAAEAAQKLGVSLPTLYAYVSRGLIRSERIGGSRERRYRPEDVAALQHRKQQRRDPGKVAEAALHWGLPVLDSAISLIANGHLYYRGRDVASLARTATIEEVAALLWSGDASHAFADEAPALPRGLWDGLARLGRELRPVEKLALALPVAEAADPSAFDLRAESVQRTGARILRLLAAVAAHRRPSSEPIATVLQRGWAPRLPKASRLLETTLVALADHELNPSTFAARCVASSGSTPYAVVAGGIASLRGFRHGGASERVEALFDEIASPERARTVLEAKLRRGEVLEGFGHPIYPQGDPRATILIEEIVATVGGMRGAILARSVAEVVRELIGVAPNVDYAVAALCRSLGLPPATSVALFALGRAVGWIAHAIEQYQDPRLIRPRARYVGEMPVR